MADTGAPWNLPYPLDTDLVKDGAQAIEDLAVAVAAVLPSAIGSNVVQTVKTDTFSTTSSSFVTITGLTATITPSTNTSKILAIATVSGGMLAVASFSSPLFRIARSGANSPVATSAGSRGAGTAVGFVTGDRQQVETSMQWLDSPASASPVTYEVQTCRINAGTVLIGAGGDDTNNGERTRSTCALLLIEVAA
jgi:hypothetical protein